MLGVAQGGIEATRWSNFRPVPTATFIRISSTTAPNNDLATINTLAGLLQNSLNQISIDGKAISLSTLVTVSPGDQHRWYEHAQAANSPNNNCDGIREKLLLIANAINSQPDLPWKAEVWGYHLAVIAKPSKGVSSSLQPTTITTNPASNAVFDISQGNTGWTRNIRQYLLGAGVGGFSSATQGRDDGFDGDAPDLADYVGNPLEQTGLYALDKVDLFNLMVIPGDDEVSEEDTFSNLWGLASAYCEQHRAFLLVDAPKSWTKDDLSQVRGNPDWVQNLRNNLVQHHAAILYPRLKYKDNNLVKSIGPAGAIAGLMARTDSTRGVWKAPAGVEANILGIVGLEVKLTDAENGVLNNLAVNCLRSFPAGFVHWGARTAEGFDGNGSEWKYIPVRRLALYIETSLYRGMQWAVFEPNDEPLWAQIRLNVGVFMHDLFRRGAFQGATPTEAYFVKCDKETTTQSDANQGIVNVWVGFAPLKPAEFVVLTISQMAGQLS